MAATIVYGVDRSCSLPSGEWRHAAFLPVQMFCCCIIVLMCRTSFVAYLVEFSRHAVKELIIGIEPLPPPPRFSNGSSKIVWKLIQYQRHSTLAKLGSWVRTCHIGTWCCQGHLHFSWRRAALKRAYGWRSPWFTSTFVTVRQCACWALRPKKELGYNTLFLAYLRKLLCKLSESDFFVKCCQIPKVFAWLRILQKGGKSEGAPNTLLVSGIFSSRLRRSQALIDSILVIRIKSGDNLSTIPQLSQIFGLSILRVISWPGIKTTVAQWSSSD